jgi:hypothetical protein
MSLTSVIKDIEHQIKCLEEHNLDEMWDVYDIKNWQATLCAVESAQQELINYSWETNPERMGQ